jgi:hypothetical protein
MLRSGFLALAALLVLAAPSFAATQTTTDPPDGFVDGYVGSTDWRSITWDSTSEPGKALLKADLQFAASSAASGQIFFDTNADNKTDYAIEFNYNTSKHPELDGSDGHIGWYLRQVTTSTTACQAYDDGTEYVNPFGGAYHQVTATRSVSGDARTSFTIPVSLADIGNATAFRWAIVGQSTASGAQLYDFVPDAGNGVPDSDPHNPGAESDPFFCSPAGDGLSAGYRVNMANAIPFNTVVIDPPPVVNQPPTATVAQSPEQARPGQPVTFTASASDSDGSVVEYAWDLDDNTTFGDASGATATRTFDTPGTYRVGVRVKDDKGATTFAYRSLEVASRTPTLTLSASKLDPLKSEKITLTANVGSDSPVADADIQWGLDYPRYGQSNGRWDAATGRTWTTGFGAPGQWIVRARFTNAEGQTLTASIQIDVPNQKPVLRDFRIRAKRTPDNPFNTDPLVKGQPILLTIGLTDDNIQRPRVEWDMDGDGGYDDALGTDVQYAFPTSGEKKIKIRVEDEFGAVTLGETAIEIRDSAEAGCNGKAGDTTIRAVGCFKTDPVDKGIKTSKEPIKLDGLDLVPQGGAQINVTAVGGVIFVTGPGTVQIKVGTTVLFDGRFRLEPNCDASKQECLLGRFSVPALSNLKGLPLKGDVDVYATPKGTRVAVNVDILGSIGLGVTARADLIAHDGTGLILNSLEVRSPMIPIGDLTIGQFFIKYDGTTRLWTGGGAITLPTPQFTTLSGDFAWSEVTGFQRAHGEVDGLNLPIDEFATVYLQRIAFTIEAKGFEAGGKPRIRLGGGIGISAGPRLASVDIATVDGDFLITFGWPLGIDIEGRISIAGFNVMGGTVSAYTNGDVSMSGFIGFGLPFPKALKGARPNATKVKVSRFSSNGADVYNPLFQIISVKGEARAWAEPKAFDLEASISAKVIGITLAKAEGLVSSKGIAGCGEIVGIRGGFGYTYEIVDPPNPTIPEKTDLFGDSCDLGPYRPVRQFQPLDDNGAGLTGRRAADSGAEPRQAPAAPAAPAATAIDVATGQKALFLKLDGTGGDPVVTLVDPDGVRYEMPASGDAVQTDGFFAARHPLDPNETYVGVRNPKPGRWQIVPQPGSAPIAAVSGAPVLPDPKVTATVRGTGKTRTIDYTVKQIPGQVVAFVEQGDDTHRTVGVAKGGRGSITFTPRMGKDRTRSVIAIVTQGDFTRARISVAAFLAPPMPRMARPRDLRARRAGHGASAGVKLNWDRVSGAGRYLVIARVDDGRTLAFTTKVPFLRIPRVARNRAVRFEVRTNAMVAKSSRWSALKLAREVTRQPKPKPKPAHPRAVPRLF